MSMVKTRDVGSWLLIAAIVAIGAVVYLRPTAHANTPALFEGSPATLDAAMAEAGELLPPPPAAPSRPTIPYDWIEY